VFGGYHVVKILRSAVSTQYEHVVVLSACVLWHSTISPLLHDDLPNQILCWSVWNITTKAVV